MTRETLLRQLKAVTEQATGDLRLPVQPQRDDGRPRSRAPEVYLMRLPDSAAAKKKAPYIIHQAITGKDVQPAGQQVAATAVVRSVFCVYHDDEQAGGLMLLALMERLRVRLLRQVILGGQFELDTQAGVESLLYPEDTAPYYAGKMITTWKLPAIEREVRQWL